MVQLQTPDWVYMGGEIRPYSEAVLHISTEAVYRGLNVFEGLKGYWNADSTQFGLVALPRHFARLKRSTRLLHIPVPLDFDEFERGTHALIRSMYEPQRDMWVRATLYVIDGHWGLDTAADLIMTAFHQPKEAPEPIAVGVSTWQRANDTMLPARIKTSTNYQVARLARIEGRGRGFSEMVLLNQAGRVAETTGAAVLMVRDGVLSTTPASEGALESITAEILLALARSMGIPTEVRPIERTELYVADELALAGTLAELTPINRIDEYLLPDDSPIIKSLLDRYRAALRGIEPHPSVDLSFV